MDKGLKAVVGMFFVAVVILGIATILSSRLVNRSLSTAHSGKISIRGIRSEIKIYRDDYGIPHIITNNEEDQFFALGYVTAQDRLWQMDLARRTANGTLSQILGETKIQSDKLFRTIGISQIAEKIAAKLSNESSIILESYTAGINTFIVKNSDRLPIEFSSLQYKPEFWKIEDCIAIQRLYAWQSSFGWKYDLTFGAIIDSLGYKAFRQLFAENLRTVKTKVHQPKIEYSKLMDAIHDANSGCDLNVGSNSWVISGAKSATGKPLIAADPHHQFGLPTIWYELQLQSPFINCYGFTIPGIPAILNGFNGDISWTQTNMMVDDMDFFIESTKDNNYLYQKKWIEMDTALNLIQIKNQPAESLVIRSTQYGPIISDLHHLLKNKNQTISMKWAGLELTDEFLGYYNLMKANNWQTFTEATKNLKIPGRNILYADTSGNIGYIGAALIPIRKAGSGEFPVPAWDGLYNWQGYIDFRDMPQSFNPADGLIISANNKMTDSHYRRFISNYWEPEYRALRIEELLSQKQKFDIDDFKRIQSDCYSKHAQVIMPLLKDVMEEVDITNEINNYFADAIKYWDYDHDPIEIAPSIFQVFLYNFLTNTFQDELGDEIFKNFMRFPSLPIQALDNIISNGNQKWFDNQTTSQIETRNDIVLKSLNDTYKNLNQKYGTLIDDWRWGKLHHLILKHPLYQESASDNMFNLEPLMIGGDNCTINLTNYSFETPFATTAGASARMIFDLSNINNSCSILSTGQSGQPLDKHYSDQVELWINGKYHKIITDKAQIKKSDFAVLVLKPK